MTQNLNDLDFDSSRSPGVNRIDGVDYQYMISCFGLIVTHIRHNTCFRQNFPTVANQKAMIISSACVYTAELLS